MLRSSETVSPKALVRASGRRSATSAMVLRSTRAATGWRSALVGIQQAFRRYPLDHLRQLPSQIHGILHADVETLSTHRRMHVRGVAGQQDPSVAIGSGLASQVGEPGDRGGTVDPVIGPVYGDERLADIASALVRRRSLAAVRSARPASPGHPPTWRWHGCRWRPRERPTPAPRSFGLRRSASSSSDPIQRTRYPLLCGSRCVLRRSRRGIPLVAMCRPTAQRRRSRRPARSQSPRGRDRSAPQARRPSRRGCARCECCHSPR